MERRNATIQETTKCIHAQTVKLVDEQTKDVGVQMEALDEFVSRARSQNEHHHVEFVSNLESLTTNARESFDKWGADIRKFKSNIDSIADISAQATESAESVAPFGEYVRECLSDLRDRVESNPLQEYIPNGQTPRKTRYNFPTVLPSTGSAEDVIARAKGLVRPPLGEKEVNSPKKAISDGASILTADPKSGGAAGIGAAFYPNAAAKQKTVPRTPDLVAGMKENLTTMGSSDEEVAETRRRSLRKRKVSDELGNLAAGTITTRRRMR
jgi:kinesin family protein 11